LICAIKVHILLKPLTQEFIFLHYWGIDKNFNIRKGGFMKNLGIGFIALVAGLMMLWTGCKKDDNPVTPPPSYVDTYTVNLTEASGTTYTGDYFPLKENYACYYLGSANIIVTMASTGTPTTQDTINVIASGMLRVLALTNINLPGGTDSLYPVVDQTNAGTTVNDTSRFFMKDSEAVYIKALKMADGNYLEVTNPVFIRSELIVGDSWETSPRLDMTKLLQNEAGGDDVQQSNLTLSARAKFFVVGGEIINLPFGDRNSIRLEQANDISIHGTVTTDDHTYNVNVTTQMAVVYHMIADTGVVHQNVTGVLNMTLVGSDYSATININIKTCELKLTSIVNGRVQASYLNLDKGSAKQLPSFNTKTEEKLWKVSQALARIITRRFSL
jgi:hypothetical protein